MSKTWVDILEFPSIIVLTGRRRYGKTVCGFYLLSQIKRMYPEIECYAKGLPEEKKHLLPDYIGYLSPDEKDLPDDSAIFLDESAMFYYARDFGMDVNKAMSILLSVSGQKNQLLIFATHYLRKLDIDIVTDLDMLAFKMPGLMHKHFERREIRPIVKKVYSEFMKLPGKAEEKKKYTYVMSNDFEGFVTNPLPDFWSSELSNAFSGVRVDDILEIRKGKRKGVMSKVWEKYTGGPDA